jgi:hypothetical protein
VRVRHGLRHGYPDEKSRTTFESTSRPTPRTQTRLTGGDHALRQTAGGTSWSAVLAQSPEPISISCAFAHAFSRDDRCRLGIALFDIVNVQNWTVIVQLPPSGCEADHRPFVNFCGERRASACAARPRLAGLSSVAEVLPCKQGVGVRFLQPAPLEPSFHSQTFIACLAQCRGPSLRPMSVRVRVPGHAPSAEATCQFTRA